MLSNRRQVSPSPKDEPQVQADKSRYFQRKVPHAVFDDPRLDLRSLYLLLQRARHADRFALNQVHISKQHGLGREGFYGALKMLKSFGYLEREQQRGDRGLSYSAEVITFGGAPVSVRRGFEILRPNFLSIQWAQQGLLDYLCSHAPRYPMTATQLAERFSVSERTIRRYLNPLLENGLVELIVEHHADGRFGRQGYVAVRECSLDGDRPDKNRTQGFHRPDTCRTHKNRTDKIRTYNNDDSCNTDDITNKDRKYRKGHYITRAEAQAMSGPKGLRPDFKVLQQDARSSEKGCQRRTPRLPGRSHISGRNEDDDRLIAQMLERTGVDECFEAVDIWVSDDRLKKLLKDGCHGRIGNALISATGIANAKRLIASDIHYRDAAFGCEEEILDAVRFFINIRLGRFSSSTGPDAPWLNSWSLIALRMAGEAYHLTGWYANYDPEQVYRKETYDSDSDIPF